MSKKRGVVRYIHIGDIVFSFEIRQIKNYWEKIILMISKGGVRRYV